MNKFFQLFILFFVTQNVLSLNGRSSSTLSNGEFTRNLFGQITKSGDKTNENVIISPVSIQTCLALTYFGAEGVTASEMLNGLHFNSGNKDVVAKQFENMLQVTKGPNSLLKIANKIYTNKNLQIKPEFNEIARRSFDSEAESLNFQDNQKAVSAINNWVSEQTNNKIKDLVNTDIIKPDTKMILVNAIHFKGNWLSPLKVQNGIFLNNGFTPRETQMMFTKDEFLYSNLNDLNAKAVQMPYANSQLNLLIILPNEKNGLPLVEEKLKSLNLIRLANERFIPSNVDISMPKFKIESRIDLKNILQNMGMRTMFTDNANFNFFKSLSDSTKVDNVLHKAFIDVNELGTEAGAATGTTINFKSIYEDFNVDHPFFFAILDKSNVYFSGHVISV